MHDNMIIVGPIRPEPGKSYSLNSNINIPSRRKFSSIRSVRSHTPDWRPVIL